MVLSSGVTMAASGWAFGLPHHRHRPTVKHATVPKARYSHSRGLGLLRLLDIAIQGE